MDDDIVAIAMAVPVGDARQQRTGREKRLGALQRGRQTRIDNLRARLHAVSEEDTQQMAIASLTVPACRVPSAARRMASRPETKLKAMMQLACSPKVRGGGGPIEKVRRLQDMSVAIVGKLCLDRQVRGWQSWLSRAPPAAAGARLFAICGVSAMWDEASQASRALLLRRSLHDLGQSQKVVNVMVVLGAVFQGAVQRGSLQSSSDVQQLIQIEWQPWCCAPLFLENTTAKLLFEGLRKSLPIEFASIRSLELLMLNADAFIISLALDSASSNLAACKMILRYVERATLCGLMLHFQRCLSHQINISRSSILSLAGVAGMLYSLSKLIGIGKNANALAAAIHDHVKANLVIRYGEPEGHHNVLRAVLDVFAIDGDGGLIWQGGCLARSRKATAFLNDLEELCKRSLLDSSVGSWVYYVAVAPSSSSRPRVDLDEAAKYISAPLVKCMVGRRWEVAALSRWTGVMRCLKRVVLGAMFNNVLPSTLSALSSNMGITDAKLEKEKNDSMAMIVRGEEANTFNLMNMTRVMKVSKYFRDATGRWQMGVLLIGCAQIEKLHWLVLGSGSENRRKANLTDLVDPQVSIIGQSQVQLLRLLQEWNLSDASPWRLLAFLGVQDLRAADVRAYSRSLVLSVSCSLFQRLEAPCGSDHRVDAECMVVAALAKDGFVSSPGAAAPGGATHQSRATAATAMHTASAHGAPRPGSACCLALQAAVAHISERF